MHTLQNVHDQQDPSEVFFHNLSPSWAIAQRTGRWSVLLQCMNAAVEALWLFRGGHGGHLRQDIADMWLVAYRQYRLYHDETRATH
jgi:hypothetical protein